MARSQITVEELYPGYVLQGAGGFKINGFAHTSPKKGTAIRPQKEGQVVAGFWNFGPLCFFVRQSGGTSYPEFSFRPLTTQFLANAIQNDAKFEFSLAQPRVGDVTYVSGTEGRDYGWQVCQGINTLNGSGGWGKEGLHLRISGELYDKSAVLDRTMPEEFNQASYFLELDIPWSVLRFMFYDKIDFLISNYMTYGSSKST